MAYLETGVVVILERLLPGRLSRDLAFADSIVRLGGDESVPTELLEYLQTDRIEFSPVSRVDQGNKTRLVCRVTFGEKTTLANYTDVVALKLFCQQYKVRYLNSVRER